MTARQLSVLRHTGHASGLSIGKTETDAGGSLAAAVTRRHMLTGMSRLQRLVRAPRQAALTLLITALKRFPQMTVSLPTTTFWGGPITVVLPEAVSGEIARFGFIEEELVAAFVQYVGPGATVLDVGAHFGFFSLLAAHLAGKHGTVHAFEPVPTTYRMLQRNTDRAGVTAVNAALWHEPGEIEITDLGVGMSAFNSVRRPRLQGHAAPARETPKIKVPALTLDAYTQDHGLAPDFVKIDAESAEFEVLQGMKRLLADIRPVVSLEVGDMDISGAMSSRHLIAYMGDHGYDAVEYGENGFVPHRVRDTYSYSNLLFLPR